MARLLDGSRDVDHLTI